MATMPNPAGRRGSTRTRELSSSRNRAPRIPEHLELSDELRRHWRRLWCSPVAAEWDPLADRQAVSRLFAIYAREEAGPVTAAEMTVAGTLERALGLNPGARQAQHVVLPGPSSASSRRRSSSSGVVPIVRLAPNGPSILDKYREGA